MNDCSQQPLYPCVSCGFFFPEAPGDLPAPFLPALRSDGDGGATALHVARRIGDAGFESACGPVEPRSAEPVEMIHAWMWARPDRWMVWGRMALGLGPGFLAGALAAEWEADRGRPTGLDPNTGKDASLDGIDEDVVDDEDVRIWCGCDDRTRGYDKGYDLLLWRGRSRSAHIARFVFDRKGDRDRLWDWMQWQTGRYKDFVRIAETEDRAALKRILYAGMLETEKSVKKAGLGSGGTRPLRFWTGEGGTDA